MSSALSPPDPYQTAAAQTQSNKDTAAYNASLNRVSQYTPYGNLVYSTTGTDPTTGAAQYRSDVSLTPEAQQQLDNQLKQNNQISDIGFGLADKAKASLENNVGAGVPALQYGVNAGQINDGSGIKRGDIAQMDTSGIPKLPGQDDFNATMQKAVNASYGRQAAFLDPQFANQRSDLEAKLASQGVNMASNPAAWARAQGDQSRSQEFAYGQARDQAIGEGTALQNNWTNQGIAENQAAATNALAQAQNAQAAQNQSFQQQLAQAMMQNQAQQQGYAQQMGQAGLNNATAAQDLQQQTALSTLPINQLNAVRSGTQIQNPTFGNVPGSNANSTDVAGLVNSNYQAQMANYNNSMNGLFGLGSAGIALLSDRRAKRDILLLGETPLMKLPIYAFKYLWDNIERVGVMAQDVVKIMPGAIVQRGGYMAVNYGLLD